MISRVCVFFAAICGAPLLAQTSLDSLAITVAGRSREFAFTNKEAAFYCGETNDESLTSWQGFSVWGAKFLDDYRVIVDGVPLDRKKATATVYPDYLKRQYPDGIVEELRIADSVSVCSIVIRSPVPVRTEIVPFFSNARSDTDFVIASSDTGLIIARKRHQQRTPQENYPVWIAARGDYTVQRRQELRGNLFSPVRFVSGRGVTHRLAFAVADSPGEARQIAEAYDLHPSRFMRRRRERMEALLTSSRFQTDDPRFNRALAWAKLSLDALIMNQQFPGIFAGLPWFDNYWGRDTFIALPGATLVTGRLATAKKILLSFARFQQTDSMSTDYGRIPNIVTLDGAAFNTADGTPRFVMMAKAYAERSGDTTFMWEMYPDIIRSIEGTLKYHADADGFLAHGDAETWMDASGPDGPWSPRGNRANDVQALWAEQLRAGVWFAARIGDPVSAARWDRVLQRLRLHFTRSFIDHGVLADHLRGDGSRAMEIRPNQIFCAPLLDDSMTARVTRTVTNQLTYRYGVASLSQDDPAFHPYHQYPPYYPKDAAYHNGTVWTWLQGALISQLCRFGEQDVAWKLTSYATHEILDRGAAGTLSELLDAIPIPPDTEPRLSGTFSQAWSLAEFVRNAYDDYLGVRINRLDRSISIRPRLPVAMRQVHARINLGDAPLDLALQKENDATSMTIKLGDGLQDYSVLLELDVDSRSIVRTQFRLAPRETARWTLRGEKAALTVDGAGREHTTAMREAHSMKPLIEPLSFVLPVLRPGLRALQGPGYPLLGHAEIAATNPRATRILDAEDPAGDDTGSGTFTYPMDPAFLPGSFDIRHCTVAADSSHVYFSLRFSSLSNPGWHPEYGFQLTIAAIAIHRTGMDGPSACTVRHNAGYPLDSAHAYQRLILVGGGLQVEDGRGKILAAYVPAESDASHPLGNAPEGTIRFALPVRILGRPTKSWRFTILAGAQDDHGGAGIGEFREVKKSPGAWNGGGKTDPQESNVYDVLSAP